MKQKFILLIIVILTIMGTYSIFVNKNKTSTAINKIRVTTSFYPLYYFTSQIGGERVDVVNITPAGAEPHEYEPTPQDMIQMQSSKLLIINGVVEPWGAKITKDFENKDIKVINTGEKLFTQTVIDEEGNNSRDPHIWLNPLLAQKEVNVILEGIISIDPQNKAYYTKNAEELNVSLSKLDKEYKSSLSSCKRKDFITSHAAFGYLASAYGLNQVAITGISPEEEPSLKELARIADFAKKNNVKYIFFESLVSPKLSQTLANEVGATTLVLNPLEGLTEEEQINGKNYLTEMQSNLHNLEIALDCK